MKRRDVENALKDCGWFFLRPGGSHDIWTNGKQTLPVPRHNEIAEGTAKDIIKTAKKNPPT